MVDTTPAYVPRLIDDLLAESVDGFGAVMVVGPRAAGKTTTAARLAAQVDRLDVPDTAAAYRADPDAALHRSARPLLIDEWQVVPDVLWAIKRAVDKDRTPGQFLLTGSLRADAGDSTWAGTGRVVRVDLHLLAEREIEAGTDLRRSGLISRLWTDWLATLPDRLPEIDIDGYMSRALRGSFPELAYGSRTTRQRQQWLDSYVDDIVQRDVSSIGASRDPVRLRRYLTVLALNLAGQPTDASMLRDADLNFKTAGAYERALSSLALVDVVPAWTSGRLKRLTRAGKRYIVDTALAAAAAEIAGSDVTRDSNLRGRWFDAFAMMQLRPEFELSSPRMRPFHLRDEGGRHEIDLVVESRGNHVFAIEFKAGAAPTREDARHLVWLRDELGSRFVGGIVLHAGRSVIEFDDRIAAVPLSACWS